MIQPTAHASHHEVSRLAGDAGDLMAATTALAEEKLSQARHHLEAGLEHGQEIYREVRRSVNEGAHSAKRVLNQNKYPVLALAVGVGALLGYLFASRCTHRDE